MSNALLRIGSDWKFETDARALIDISFSDALSSFRKGDLVTFRVIGFLEDRGCLQH